MISSPYALGNDYHNQAKCHLKYYYLTLGGTHTQSQIIIFEASIS